MCPTSEAFALAEDNPLAEDRSSRWNEGIQGPATTYYNTPLELSTGCSLRFCAADRTKSEVDLKRPLLLLLLLCFYYYPGGLRHDALFAPLCNAGASRLPSPKLCLRQTQFPHLRRRQNITIITSSDYAYVDYALSLSIGPVPYYCSAMHYAPVRHIIRTRVVLGRSVIPECQVVQFPAPANSELWSSDMCSEKT